MLTKQPITTENDPPSDTSDISDEDNDDMSSESSGYVAVPPWFPPYSPSSPSPSRSASPTNVTSLSLDADNRCHVLDGDEIAIAGNYLMLPEDDEMSRVDDLLAVWTSSSSSSSGHDSGGFPEDDDDAHGFDMSATPTTADAPKHLPPTADSTKHSPMVDFPTNSPPPTDAPKPSSPSADAPKPTADVPKPSPSTADAPKPSPQIAVPTQNSAQPAAVLPASWQPAARRAIHKSHSTLARAVDNDFPFDVDQVVTHELTAIAALDGVAGIIAYSACVESMVINRNSLNYVESVQRQVTKLVDNPDGTAAVLRPVETTALNYETRNGVVKAEAQQHQHNESSVISATPPPLLYSALADDEASSAELSVVSKQQTVCTEAKFPTMMSSWSTANSMAAICGDDRTNPIFEQLAVLLMQSSMQTPPPKLAPASNVPVYHDWEAALESGLTNSSRRSPVASTPPPTPRKQPVLHPQQQQTQQRPMRPIVGARQSMANIPSHYSNQQQQYPMSTTQPPPGFYPNNGNNNYTSNRSTSVAAPSMYNNSMRTAALPSKDVWQASRPHPFLQHMATEISQFSSPPQPPKLQSCNDYANKENELVEMMGCTFCKKNGESPQVYMSHQLKQNGQKTCPVLQDCLCAKCGNRGHTAGHCTNPTTSILKLMAQFSGANF